LRGDFWSFPLTLLTLYIDSISFMLYRKDVAGFYSIVGRMRKSVNEKRSVFWTDLLSKDETRQTWPFVIQGTKFRTFPQLQAQSNERQRFQFRDQFPLHPVAIHSHPKSIEDHNTQLNPNPNPRYLTIRST